MSWVISLVWLQLLGCINYNISCCITTHPKPFSDASLYITIPPVLEDVFQIGAIISPFFNYSNVAAHSSVHTYFFPFLMSFVNGVAVLEKFCTKFL